MPLSLNPLSPAPTLPVPFINIAAWWAVLAVLGIALLLGRLVVPRLRGWCNPELWLLRAVAGFLPVGLLVLAVGQFPGLFHRIPWSIFGLAGWIYLVASLGWRRVRCGAPDPNPSTDRKSLLETIGWVAVVIWLAAMLAPALAPSVSYDVLEYHLAFAAQIVRDGQVAPIPNVFYSAQPLLTELLDALAALIEGNPWGNAPGLLHWLIFLLATLLFARLAAHLDWPRASRPWLWLLLLSHPIIFILQLDRFTDFTGALFLLAGLTLATHRSSTQNPIATPLLLGVFAAGAVGAKWTNVGTVAIPFLALAASQPTGSAKGPLKNLALFGASSLIFFAPWPLWLWAETANPAAPFLAQWFSTERWPPVRLDFLLHTHGPLSPLAIDYWSNLASRIAVGLGGAPLVLLGLLAGAAHTAVGFARRRRGIADPSSPLPVPLLTLSLIIGLLLWGHLRHGAARFLAPTHLLALVLLGNFLSAAMGWEADARKQKAQPPGRLPQLVAGSLAILAVFIALHPLGVAVRTALPVALGRIDQRDFLRNGLGSITAGMFEAVNALPNGSRILALDEARGFYFAPDVTLASVFDRHPIVDFLESSADSESLAANLRAAGYTHVLVNEFESARLLAFHPPIDLESNPDFQRLRAAYLSPNPRDRAAAQRELSRQFPGWSAFAAIPLSEPQKAILLDFLIFHRPGATWRGNVDGETDPAIWLAPLKPPR